MVFAGLTDQQIAAASSPRLVVGEGVLASELASLASFAVTTMPEPWARVPATVRDAARAVLFVTDMEQSTLDRMTQAVPAVDTVVGVGGGASVDAAKYVAWRKSIGLITAPTIVSVDASVTNTIAVRESGRVRYIGWALPSAIVVDTAIVRTAPPRLNRAGIGDILSIHTGSFDWRLAERAGLATVDEAIAASERALVDGLFANADAIRDVSPAGIELIMRSYIANNAACMRAGTAQPEEGSEHFWAYHLEYLTGRQFAHGEVVSLGVLVMSQLQENEPERIRALLDGTGVRYQPRDLGISRDEFDRSLLGLRDYVRAEGLWHTVVDERPPDAAFVTHAAEGLRF